MEMLMDQPRNAGNLMVLLWGHEIELKTFCASCIIILLGFLITLCWKDLHDDKIGRLDNQKAFVSYKWVGLSVVCLHGLVLSLAMIFRSSGFHQFNGSEEDYAVGKASLLNQPSAHVIGATNYGSKIDVCQMRIKDKTKLARLAYHLKKQEKSSMLDATDDYISAATYQVLMITFVDTKLACRCLFELQVSRMVLLSCWINGLEGYHVLIMAGLKARLLRLIAWYGASSVVLAMSLTLELVEKPECVKTSILKMKLEDKFMLKGEEM